MLGTTVGGAFTARTPILSASATHKAGSLGHRGGSTGVEMKRLLVSRKMCDQGDVCR